VGEACENYHKLPLKTRGMYITLHDKGRVAQKLKEWPEQDIKVAVITDGERILGLGETHTHSLSLLLYCCCSDAAVWVLAVAASS